MTNYNASAPIMDQDALERAINGALEGLLYTQRHQNGANMESVYSTCDASQKLWDDLCSDFKNFVNRNRAHLAALDGLDLHEIGLDWIMARNREVGGFSERKIGAAGEYLDSAAREQGEVLIYGNGDFEFSSRG